MNDIDIKKLADDGQVFSEVLMDSPNKIGDLVLSDSDGKKFFLDIHHFFKITSDYQIEGVVGKINEDGSWTITQKNEDGKIQTVNAVLDRNTGKMTIDSKFDDGSKKTQEQTNSSASSSKTNSRSNTEGNTGTSPAKPAQPTGEIK